MFRGHIQQDETKDIMRQKHLRARTRGVARKKGFPTWIVRVTGAAVALVMLMSPAGFAEESFATSGGTLMARMEAFPQVDLYGSPVCISGWDWEYSCNGEYRFRRPAQGSSDDMRPRDIEIGFYEAAVRALDKDHMVYTSSDMPGLSFAFVVVEPRTRGFQLGAHLRFQFSF